MAWTAPGTRRRIGPQTLARAWALGIKPAQALADNDGHGFFKALGARS